MKRFLLLIAFVLVCPLAAGGQQFAAGQRVEIGSTGETGTVLKTGQATPEGGIMVQIRLDKPSGPTEADRDVWYNSKPSRVTLLPANAPAATPPATAPTPPQAVPRMAKTQFEAGDRVNIGSLGVNGTVVQVLGVLGNGAQMMRIEIDKNAPKYPGVSNTFDTISSKITPLN